MPTKQFFRLTQEKQQLILDSAKREFSDCRFEHASINRIISTALISRGAFYYYFQDKEDIYWYMLDCIVEEFSQKMDIKKSNGDVFEIVSKVFEFFVAKSKTSEFKLYQMIVENMKPGTTNFLVNSFHKKIKEEAFDTMEKSEWFRYKEKGELKYLMNMLFHNFVISASKLYLWNQGEEEARKRFVVGLDILRNGAIIHGGLK